MKKNGQIEQKMNKEWQGKEGREVLEKKNNPQTYWAKA